jgi:catechol 2,3-dioxygenase-like lactoylglutathione lyase family enzyme
VTTLSNAELVAFIATTDAGRARAFYEGVLGLPVVHDDSFACVVDAHGTTVRITTVPERADASYTVLGWKVDDLDGIVDDLIGRGIAFLRFDGLEQDPRGIWSAPSGDRIAWFHDPDGNTLSLQASPGGSGSS